MTNEIYAVLSITATLLSCITTIFSILAYCKVVGMEKSTHKIQWVPADDMATNPTGDALVEKMKGMYQDEY